MSHDRDACREAWVVYAEACLPEGLTEAELLRACEVFQGGWNAAHHRARRRGRDALRKVATRPNPSNGQDAEQNCARCRRPRKLRELVSIDGQPAACKEPTQRQSLPEKPPA